ncbi:Opsin 1-like 2, partial [Homarus americanus]
MVNSVEAVDSGVCGHPTGQRVASPSVLVSTAARARMNAPADLVPLISEHWMRFPQPHPLLHITLGITFTLLTTIAFVGNLTVIIMYCSAARNIIPCGVIVVDSPLWSAGCEVYGAVSLLAGLSAIWFLTAISLDRYYVVRHSLNTHHRSPRFQGVLSGCTVDYLSESWVDRSFVYMLLVIAWASPMAAVIFSYTYIAIKEN